MNNKSKNCCPGRLAEGFETYSPLVLKRMFKGKNVSAVLPYLSPKSTQNRSAFSENQTHISISGFQEKYSLILDDKTLRLTKDGEMGQYILKPISDLPKNNEFAPANEHLTMQIASQIFKIETAENAMIFFQDNSPAYITKRFDVQQNGTKCAVEDFASLLQKSPATHGEQYKYQGNYLDVFQALKKYVPSWQVEAPKLFSLILFNYLFSNGDAHLKNFSLIETLQGDFKLSPAYDLLNTRIHIDDSDFALNEGLLPKNLSKGKIREQFILLGQKAEIRDNTIAKIFKNLTSNEAEVIALTHRSFLSEKLKKNFIQSYQGKLNKIMRS